MNIAGTRGFKPLELEKSVVNFLDYFEGLVKMCIPEINPQSGRMPRFWVHFTDCFYAVSREKTSVVKRIYTDNFRSTCEEQILVMYGE